MIDKKTASRLYAMNQMGVSSDPKPKRPRKSKDQDVSMSCSEHGCSAYDSGSGRSGVGEKTNRQNKGGAKGLSSKPQYKSKVLKEGSFKANRHQRKIEKVRSSKPVSKQEAMFKADRSKF